MDEFQDRVAEPIPIVAVIESAGGRVLIPKNAFGWQPCVFRLARRRRRRGF